jgi:hypothetical protein
MRDHLKSVAYDTTHLQCKEKTYCLERKSSSVNVVTQEEIINVSYVTRGTRTAVLGKKTHNIPKLAVQVAKNLHRRIKMKNNTAIEKK